MAKRKSMSEGEVVSLLDRQLSSATTYVGSETQQLRLNALKFVDGEIDIPEREGCSRVVSHDVADTLNAIMPSLLRVFTATDQIGVYEPRRQDFVNGRDVSEERARQATDYINYVFLTECRGYSVLHSAMYDGLLFGNGLIKHWWDTAPVYTTEDYTGLSDDAYGLLLQDEDVEEVLEHSERPDPSFALPQTGIAPPEQPAAQPPAPNSGPQAQGPGAVDAPPVDAAAGPPDGDPLAATLAGPGGDGPPAPVAPQGVPPELAAMMGGMGQPGGMPGGMPNMDPMAMMGGMMGMMAPPPPPMLHDVKIKRRVASGRLMVKALPHEEFLIGPVDTVIDEEETQFCAHTYRETRGALIASGYEREKVEKLSTLHNSGNNEEDVQRRRYIDDKESDWAGEEVQVNECYMRLDMDGDGIAELVKVVIGGPSGERTLLDMEEWGDDLPFSDLVPSPIPHRWRGRSVFDDTADIQRIKSVLLRQTLDNLYQTNNPQMQALEGAVANMDALVNRELGGVVLVRQQGAVAPLDVPFTAQQSFGMLSYFDEVNQKRTGVGPQAQGLNPDALQNQTAMAAQLQQSNAYAKFETYARNIAENGLKRLFSCMYRLIVKHQDRPKTIRLRGKWVEFNPSVWTPEMDVTVNTGVGTGSRERDMAMLQGVLAEQKQLIGQGGPFNPVSDIRKLRNTLAKMVETAGLKAPERYFEEISDEQYQAMKAKMSEPPPPDPKMQLEQAKMQLDMQKFQMQQQFELQKLQMVEQHKQQEMQIRAQFEQLRTDHANTHEEQKLGKQVLIEQKQKEADIAVEQAKAEHAAQLNMMKFEHDRKMRLLEMRMKAWEAMRQNMQSVQPGVDTSPFPRDLMAEADDFAGDMDPELAEMGVPPMTPLEEAAQSIRELAQRQEEAAMRLDETQRQLNETSERLMSGLEQLARYVAAPSEIVRDDKGRVAGSRKVLN
jgi:hypothetical protein